jgi:GT2 family glycosyltransferase
MKQEFDITISVVIYNNDPQMLARLFQCITAVKLNVRTLVIDNARDDRIRALCDGRIIKYIRNDRNVGYGAGHNVAIKTALDSTSYHLVLNPDIYFEPGALESLYAFMQANRDIGLVMPKILYPDGSLQYLCRLLPSPFDLFVRRFKIPFLSTKRDAVHALQSTGYNRIMDVPYLSGCFMFLRADALRKAGVFDERFFMYMEDVDLARRIGREYRNTFYPNVQVYHGFKKESYASIRQMYNHSVSAFRYFNKWGWFFDRQRRAINERALRAVNHDIGSI